MYQKFGGGWEEHKDTTKRHIQKYFYSFAEELTRLVRSFLVFLLIEDRLIDCSIVVILFLFLWNVVFVSVEA